MEFELIEEPCYDEREDGGDALSGDLPVLNDRLFFGPQRSRLEDQAVCIPEQEDG